MTIAPAASAAAPCPNDATRTGASAALPDCRAYELVTPPQKVAGAQSIQTFVDATPDGDHIAFALNQAMIEQNDAWPVIYRSDRGGGGWATVAPDPKPYVQGAATLLKLTSDLGLLELTARAYSPDDQDIQPNSGNTPSLDVYKIGPGPDVGFLSRGSLNPVNSTALPQVYATTEDGSFVAFGFDDPLLPADVGRESGRGLYVATPSGLKLVSVDSTGARLTSGSVEFGSSSSRIHAMSNDGSRVFFTAEEGSTPTGNGGFYVRENGETTTPIPATPAGINGQVTFLGATPSGSAVFLGTAAQLSLDDADSDYDVYRYDVDTHQATLLSVGSGSGQVLPRPMYSSDDGQRVYFTVYGQLQPGMGVDGVVSTYMWDRGTVRFVAATQALVASSYLGEVQCGTAHVTPDGRYLLFESADQFAPGDTDSQTDVFLYDAVSDKVVRVSEGPVGGNGGYGAYINSQGVTGNRCDDRALQPSYPVSDDGRTVFFQTQEQLLSKDTNSDYDVYEYKVETQQLSLISAGRGHDDSQYLTSTPSGDTVFISTTDRLVPSDVDGFRDIYSVRVNGGYADAAKPPACRESDCQGTPATVPTPPIVASVSFAGPGNSRAERKPASSRPRVRIVRRSARGTNVRLRVLVPGAGRISVGGAHLRRSTRTVRRAGTYTVTVRLTAAAARALQRKHRMRLKLRVGYLPNVGEASSVTVTIQVRK